MDQELYTIIITIGGILWSIFKATNLYRQYKDKTVMLAVECVAAGALSAFDTYRYKKDGKKIDTPLSDQDRKEMVVEARKAAIELGNKRGISIVNTLGGESFLDLHLEKQLQRFK